MDPEPGHSAARTVRLSGMSLLEIALLLESGSLHNQAASEDLFGNLAESYLRPTSELLNPSSSRSSNKLDRPIAPCRCWASTWSRRAPF